MTRSNQGMWELEKDATLRLAADRGGIFVEVDRGTVLVTREGDPEDHVVAPGEPARLAGGGLVVAWALTPARLRVAPASPARARLLAMGQAA